MKTKLSIAIDIDGVIADFMAGVRLYYPDYDIPAPKDWNNFLPSFGMHRNFWHRVYTTWEFHEKIPLTPQASDIIKICQRAGDVFFLTKATNPLSASHKLRWIDLYFQAQFPVVLLTGKMNKEDFAYDILIDDHPKLQLDGEFTLETPEKKLITFPASYNQGNAFTGSNPYDFVEKLPTILDYVKDIKKTCKTSASSVGAVRSNRY